jgi:hypothetical protein
VSPASQRRAEPLEKPEQTDQRRVSLAQTCSTYSTAAFLFCSMVDML